MREPILTIAVATLSGQGRRWNDDSYPADWRWTYIIYQQGGQTEDQFAPITASRADCEFREVASLGVTKSRNVALRDCRTQLLLFCDDDVSLTQAALEALVDTFDKHPAIDLIAGKTVDSRGRPLKRYPKQKTPLTLFNTGKIGTVELAVRTQAVQTANVTFDESFGAGTTQKTGDEYIFVTDCLKKGLKGLFVPIAIATHPPISSGSDWVSESSALTRRLVLERVFGPWAPVMKLAFLLRNVGKFRDVSAALRFLQIFIRTGPR